MLSAHSIAVLIWCCLATLSAGVCLKMCACLWKMGRALIAADDTAFLGHSSTYGKWFLALLALVGASAALEKLL